MFYLLRKTKSFPASRGRWFIIIVLILNRAHQLGAGTWPAPRPLLPSTPSLQQGLESKVPVSSPRDRALAAPRRALCSLLSHVYTAWEGDVDFSTAGLVLREVELVTQGCTVSKQQN